MNTSQEILIINGPNLGKLGTREPHIYGYDTMEKCLCEIISGLPSDVTLQYVQSNHEGNLIDYIEQAAERGVRGIVLNAGGYTHTSIALADAVAAAPIPIIEVHISNVFAREPFRHTSLISPYAAGVIVGVGMVGYRLAVQALLMMGMASK